MGSIQRKIIKNLFKNLQKKYKSVPELLPRNREVLELYSFTMFLENTPLEEALKAFSTLERYFIDWNEVRVSTSNELANLFSQLNEPAKTGERLRRILQWIFEVRYKFDLEDLRAQNAETVLEFFKTIPYSTSFMNACMIFLLFDKPSIPLDEGSKRVLRLLECMEINNQNQEEPQGLEAISTRAEKVLFFVLLHNLGAIMMQDDKSEAIKFLKIIDPQADVRAWLPLVESNEIDDPAEIAKQMMQKERHRSLPPIQLESELDLLDDNYDPSSLDPEADNFNPAEEEDFPENPVAEESLIFEHSEELTVNLGKKQESVKIKKTTTEISVKQKKNVTLFEDLVDEDLIAEKDDLKTHSASAISPNGEIHSGAKKSGPLNVETETKKSVIAQNNNLPESPKAKDEKTQIAKTLPDKTLSEETLIEKVPSEKVPSEKVQSEKVQSEKAPSKKIQPGPSESNGTKENAFPVQTKSDGFIEDEKKSAAKGTKPRKSAKSDSVKADTKESVKTDTKADSVKADSMNSEKESVAKEAKRKKSAETSSLAGFLRKNRLAPEKKSESSSETLSSTPKEKSVKSPKTSSRAGNVTNEITTSSEASEMKPKKKGTPLPESDKTTGDISSNNDLQAELPKVPEKKTAAPKKSAPKKSEKNVKPVKAVPPPSKTVKEADVKKLQKKKPR